MPNYDTLTNQPVVIDNGSGALKAGFAGENQPQCVFQSYVGVPKHLKVMAGGTEGDKFIGKKAEELRGLLKIKYPIEHGVVTDWDDMKSIWKYAYQELHIPTEDHPVLLTDAPLNPRKNREKAAEIFFEGFNVPALYASGRTTGIVLDSGDGVTHAVPIFEGFAMPHAIIRNDVAGREITNYLQLLLRRGGCGYNFHTSAEREVVRNIKEKACYVAYNLQQAEDDVDAGNSVVKFKLPDGNIIDIGAETFRAPEVLFQPELIGLEYSGIHEAVANSIQRADLDMRKRLYGNIVLAGGSTLFKGFGDRLLKELMELAPKDTKIKIAAPPERINSTWIGGSILAALPTFKKMWVWKDEYSEDGARILHKRTF